MTDKAKAEELKVGNRVEISMEDVTKTLQVGQSVSSMVWAPGAELDLVGWSNWCGRELVGKFRVVGSRPDARLIILEKV